MHRDICEQVCCTNLHGVQVLVELALHGVQGLWSKALNGG